MRLREKDVPITPEVERELAALEAALAGRSVDPDLAELAQLAQGIRELRPQMPAELAARLDADEAAGFERSRRRLPGADLGRRIGERLARAPRRRLLPALGAAATLAIVTGVAIDQSGVVGGGSGPSGGGTAVPVAKPLTASPPATPPVTAAGRQEQVQPASGGDVISEPPIPPVPGGIAPGHRNRVVQRDASLTLSTGADKVRDVADQVIAVTQRYRGFVLTSSVRGGDAGQAGASFDLRVPTSQLQPALADLSRLAHVSSLSENGQDITAPFVSSRHALRTALHERDVLLRRLAAATSPDQTASIRAELRIVRARIAAAGSRLHGIKRQADLAAVAVSIDANGESSDSGSTLHNALSDALHVLAVSLGVAIVALAVMVPLALIALAAWLGGRSARRRRRESALDG